MISYIMKGNGKKIKNLFWNIHDSLFGQTRVDWAFWSIISSRKKRGPRAPELGLIVKVLNGPVFSEEGFLLLGFMGFHVHKHQESDKR